MLHALRLTSHPCPGVVFALHSRCLQRLRTCSSVSESGGTDEIATRDVVKREEEEEVLKRGVGKEIKRTASSLRVDTIASAGLGIGRSKIWELSFRGKLMLNGEPVKKSTQVKVGDIVELDHAGAKKGQKSDKKKGVIAKRKRWIIKQDKTPVEEVEEDEVDRSVSDEGLAGEGKGEGDGSGSHDDGIIVRGRVVVKEIGDRTRKGGYHVTLVRYKHYALFRKVRKFSTYCINFFCK